jgi:hypothetical protein
MLSRIRGNGNLSTPGWCNVVSCSTVGWSEAGVSEHAGTERAGIEVQHDKPRISPLMNIAPTTVIVGCGIEIRLVLCAVGEQC